MSVVLCLYSKYSQRCKEFLDDVREEMDIQMLCIDHREIRDMISKDMNGYHVRTVPCIFILYSNGRLEKYEGSDAFVWLRKLKDEIAPSSSSVPAQVPAQVPVQPTPTQPLSAPSSPPPSTSIDEIEMISTVNTEPPKQTVEELIDKEMSMRRATDQVITKKNEGIKELAQMLQRQRESEEEQMNPPPPGLIGSK
jgi:hypothetical protein